MRWRLALRRPALLVLAIAAPVGASMVGVAEDAKPPDDLGAHVYMEARCFACHGQYGFGAVGPRLRENRFVALSDYVIGQILVGRQVMPSFATTLSNDQIAAVASYIRSSWGNNFGPVKPEEVAKIRQEMTIHPPDGRPHLPPQSKQPPGVPVPPNVGGPPGQALPPQSLK